MTALRSTQKVFTTADFTYSKELHSMYAEASTLGPFGNVISIRSTHTQKVAVFKRISVIRDTDHHVAAWNYTSAQVPGITVRIFND